MYPGARPDQERGDNTQASLLRATIRVDQLGGDVRPGTLWYVLELFGNMPRGIRRQLNDRALLLSIASGVVTKSSSTERD